MYELSRLVNSSCCEVSLRRKGTEGREGTQEVPAHNPNPGVLDLGEEGRSTEEINSHRVLERSCSWGWFGEVVTVWSLKHKEDLESVG